ncbi:hypothetical protein OH76DRAFT_1419890 [Lentinus brumalis]|uniref:Uncharacterized protein n=1 Tax=Lentinus brumalis TaxID=2498619 RepID=A0A371D3F7_9APHY|nr:hypothetical protein OH76DRAFT_1419890 [Polyporus brumalis]
MHRHRAWCPRSNGCEGSEKDGILVANALEGVTQPCKVPERTTNHALSYSHLPDDSNIMDMTLPMPLGFQRVAPIYHDNTVAAEPALRYLASIFGVRWVRFTYGEFAAAMAGIGLFDDQDEGMLLGWQQPFPYNPAGLPLTTVVTRRVQAEGARIRMMGLKPTTVKTTMTAKKTKKAQMQARRLKLRMSTLRFNDDCPLLPAVHRRVLDAEQEHEDKLRNASNDVPRASPQRPAPVERCNLSLGSGAARARTGRSEQTSLRTRLLDPDLSPSVRCHNSANREEEMRPQTRLLLIDVACTARHIKIVNRREETSLKTSSPPPRPLTERGDESEDLVSSSSPSAAAVHTKSTKSNEETGPKSRLLVPDLSPSVLRSKCASTSEKTRLKSLSPPQSLPGFLRCKSATASGETGLSLSPPSDAARACTGVRRRVRRPRLLLLAFFRCRAHQEHEHERGDGPEEPASSSAPSHPRPPLQEHAQERRDESEDLVSSSSPSSAAVHIKSTKTNEETGPKSPPHPDTSNDETSAKTRIVASDLSPRVRRSTSMPRSQETSPQTSSPLLSLFAATHINGATSPRPQPLVIAVLRGKCANTSEETRLKSFSPQSLAGFKSASTSDETGLSLSPASDAARAHRREETSPKTSSPPRRPCGRLPALQWMEEMRPQRRLLVPDLTSAAPPSVPRCKRVKPRDETRSTTRLVPPVLPASLSGNLLIDPPRLRCTSGSMSDETRPKTRWLVPDLRPTILRIHSALLMDLSRVVLRCTSSYRNSETEEPGVHGAPGDASNEGGSKGVVAKVEETDTDMYQVERAWLQGVYARCKFGQKSFAATKDQGVNVQQDVYHDWGEGCQHRRAELPTIRKSGAHRIPVVLLRSTVLSDFRLHENAYKDVSSVSLHPCVPASSPSAGALPS